MKRILILILSWRVGTRGYDAMTVLVVGADRLGNIEAFFRDRGYREILHVTGRKASDAARHIPANVHMVVVFTDFVSHNLARVIKAQAKARNIRVIFSKRSCSALAKTLCLA